MDPSTDEASIYNTTDGTIIQRYSKEVCGARVKNVQKRIAGTWTLIGSSKTGDTDKDSFVLDVLSIEKLK